MIPEKVTWVRFPAKINAVYSNSLVARGVEYENFRGKLGPI